MEQTNFNPIGSKNLAPTQTWNHISADINCLFESEVAMYENVAKELIDASSVPAPYTMESRSTETNQTNTSF